MSAVSKRTKHTIRHEYFIPSPACWTDVQKAMKWAAEDRTERGLSNDWDDIIRVEGNEETVIVYWEDDAK